VVAMPGLPPIRLCLRRSVRSCSAPHGLRQEGRAVCPAPRSGSGRNLQRTNEVPTAIREWAETSPAKIGATRPDGGQGGRRYGPGRITARGERADQMRDCRPRGGRPVRADHPERAWSGWTRWHMGATLPPLCGDGAWTIAGSTL
jgi:hypothetical protein